MPITQENVIVFYVFSIDPKQNGKQNVPSLAIIVIINFLTDGDGYEATAKG